MNDAVEPAHDDYGASSAKRWTSCLGSVRLCALAPPSQDSEWGDEGRAAHNLAEACLLRGEMAATGPAGVTVDMVRSVNIYLEYVYGILRDNPGAILRVENRVKVPSSCVPNRMGGTFDARIYAPLRQWMYVLDYKHGAGIYVEEEDNLQMFVYDIGSLFSSDDPIAGFTNVIIQPRSWQAGGAVRPFDVSVLEVLAKHAWFEERALLTLDENAPLNPTPENCRWCTAGGYGLCPEADWSLLRAVGDPSIKRVQDLNISGLPSAKSMSIERMTFWMVNEPAIQALMKNIRMTATGMAKNGIDFPLHKLVLGQTERAWYGEHLKIAQTLAALLGVPIEDVMPPTLITLTEAENRMVDLFRNGVTLGVGETKKSFKARQNKASELAREAMAMLTLKEPKGAPRLVPLSDSRPALETGVPHLAGILNMEGLK